MTPSPPAATETSARLAELLTWSARRFHRGVGARLAPLGLTWPQARLMRLVDEPGSSMRMADIASRLGIVPRSATSIVDTLESGGFVVRHPDLLDRRSVLVSLSPEGRRLLDGLEAARQATAEALFGHLGEADAAELLRLLEGLADGDGPCAHGRARR